MDRDPAFDLQLQAMWKPLVLFAKKICKNETLAEDMAQSTIAKALEHHKSFQSGTNLKGWLFTILRNDYFSMQRKRRREVEDIDGVFSLNLSIPEGQSAAYDLKVVKARMKRLPVEFRVCVQRVCILGHEYETVAQELNIPVGTVKSRINRARHFLETGAIVEDAIDPPEEPQETSTNHVQRISDLYKSGSSVSEISAAMGGMKKSKIMSILASKNIQR